MMKPPLICLLLDKPQSLKKWNGLA
jgi:hypothetical protein